MKTLALSIAACAAFTVSTAADTPDAILADYRAKATPALAKVNDTLEQATVPILAELVKEGDTAGIEQVKAQLQAKQSGDPVPNPHPKAASLFALYDAARIKALEPAQKSTIGRIEAMLKTSDGKKLEVVEALGKVRAEIEGGKATPTKSAYPKKWGYYLTAAYDKKHGTLTLKDDGTLVIDAASPGTGTWQAVSPTVIAVDIQNAAKIEEKTQIVIEGDKATFKRVSGTRYLKVE